MKNCFKVACKKEKLREIRCFAKHVLDEYGLKEADVNTLVLAIDEVCANLIIHSHFCNPRQSIEIEINLDENNLVVNIIDKTEIFNINDYEEPSLDDIIKKQRKGGVGLILVKKIMDDIQIFSEDKKHVCRLIKKVKVQ